VKNRRDAGKRFQLSAAASCPATSSPGHHGLTALALGAVLITITLAAFWGVGSNSFVNMDDDVYVFKNARIQAGPTWDNVKWAFSNESLGFYFPLTLISHMIDCRLYGSWAGGHHITSLILHILSALMLFAALSRASGAAWKSFAVAALFAVHPLHVESVAWAAERKDVLCAFFWFACLLAYVTYANKPSAASYFFVVMAFLCGLLSKPMVITLPFVLLLLDYWPLERWSPFNGGQGGKGTWDLKAFKRLLLEKLPLFVLVPVFALISFSAQKQAKAIASIHSLQFDQRVINALVSCAAYLKEMFIPLDLAAYYPLPRDGVSFRLGAACGILLVALTVAFMWFGRRKKYLAAGWLWYVGALLPVIGIVQIGAQSMADRYTYIPLVGLFIIIVWGASWIVETKPMFREASVAASAIVLLILVILTRIQAGYWANSEKLFGHTLEITSDNYFIHNNLGVVLYENGRHDEATVHYNEALRVNPEWPEANYNLATALLDSGDYAEAAAHYETALKQKRDPEGLSNLGFALTKIKRLPEAVERLNEAIRLNPDLYYARVNLAAALSEMGQAGKAFEQYKEALRIDPGSAEALDGMGQSLMLLGRKSEALERFREAVIAQPDSLSALVILGNAFGEAGRTDDAMEQYAKALKISPSSAHVLNNCGLVLARAGRMAEAEKRFREAVKAAPDFPDAYINLGFALLQEGKAEEAAVSFRGALKLTPSSGIALENLQKAENMLKKRGR
jgi:protein O-mannosyl-transferase